MSILGYIRLTAALASVIFGVVALIFPEQTAKAAFLKADTKKGEAEIRASWGGFYIGLGLAVIFLDAEDAYFAFGIAYAITALVRAGTWLRDRKLINRNSAIIMAFEVISAIIFAIPGQGEVA